MTYRHFVLKWIKPTIKFTSYCYTKMHIMEMILNYIHMYTRTYFTIVNKQY